MKFIQLLNKVMLNAFISFAEAIIYVFSHNFFPPCFILINVAKAELGVIIESRIRLVSFFSVLNSSLLGSLWAMQFIKKCSSSSIPALHNGQILWSGG